MTEIVSSIAIAEKFSIAGILLLVCIVLLYFVIRLDKKLDKCHDSRKKDIEDFSNTIISFKDTFTSITQRLDKVIDKQNEFANNLTHSLERVVEKQEEQQSSFMNFLMNREKRVRKQDRNENE